MSKLSKKKKNKEVLLDLRKVSRNLEDISLEEFGKWLECDGYNDEFWYSLDVENQWSAEDLNVEELKNEVLKKEEDLFFIINEDEEEDVEKEKSEPFDVFDGEAISDANTYKLSKIDNINGGLKNSFFGFIDLNDEKIVGKIDDDEENDEIDDDEIDEEEIDDDDEENDEDGIDEEDETDEEDDEENEEDGIDDEDEIDEIDEIDEEDEDEINNDWFTDEIDEDDEKEIDDDTDDDELEYIDEKENDFDFISEDKRFETDEDLEIFLDKYLNENNENVENDLKGIGVFENGSIDEDIDVDDVEEIEEDLNNIKFTNNEYNDEEDLKVLDDEEEVEDENYINYDYEKDLKELDK